LSTKLKDLEGFERHINQLKPYYHSPRSVDFQKLLVWNLLLINYSSLQLPDKSSPHQYTILGLNLLRLLSETKLADFHTELELIPVEMFDFPAIKYPIQLEQYMMEGSYTKITEAVKDVPFEIYSFFNAKLIETVRCAMRIFF
jgi:26S proteasome regulatory subunit N12